MNEMSSKNIKEIPLPACRINKEGKISEASKKIGQVFLYDGIVGTDIFALTGSYFENFLEKSKTEEATIIKSSDKFFKVIVEANEDETLDLFFVDITEGEKAREELEQTKLAIALIHVDNYDELTGQNSEDKELAIAAEIDKAIRNWSKKIKASTTKYKDHLYITSFEQRSLLEEEKKDFPILDEIKEIETEVDFPVTLSIGVGINGETPGEIETLADEALDLALGRGGDQVVIKNRDKISYYGGKSETVEKSNKGKSRIIALALKALIDSSSNVIIMGHYNPDMDFFGSALGLHSLAKPIKKETHILLDSHNETLDTIIKKAKETEEYSFVNREKAKSMVNEKTLVIVLDTHRPSITECPELLSLAEKVVVIDHHRKGEEFIKNPTLAYTEPYASSTAELVTEILQYGSEKRRISKLEAEGLLAGMSVDTNRFSVKTGVRTFEAAAWLRRAGADTAVVKRYFQTNLEMFMTKANCVANAQITEEGFATSVCEGKNANAQIVNAQVADELLTIEGVKASFVAGKSETGQTIVSARSLGDINVQTVMEKFGGGGHLTTAGTQLEGEPSKIIGEIVALVKKEME